ncbi:MAG: DNA methylase, partial [Spirochaetia bacterium]|nr:DNA methylase [Spirochaetia bacterium]
YFAIDLKSFYASVECVERHLDPLTTNLVVADLSRTEKTICLAVSPSLKAYGIKGRCRLFEVVQKAREVEARTGTKLEYITAVPRMALYLEYSARIYGVYLKYFSPDDIHVYSIDEVFIDATPYLGLYKTDAKSLLCTVIKSVLAETGITATAGIAPNLFLCKVAMDIVAKHSPPDQDGVRIAELTVESYRKRLWDHQPITDFWRIGAGTAARLARYGMHTMGDIALHSLHDSALFYRLFGIDAEILIDHAWGLESCTISHIKSYRSTSKSLCSGQVLHHPYPHDKARLVVREMAESLAQDLVAKELASEQFSLYIMYDKTSTPVPRADHGLVHLGSHTASLRRITQGILDIFDQIADPELLIRRLHVTADTVVHQKEETADLFTDTAAQRKERSLQNAMLSIQDRFGKNAILKADDYIEGATIRERNNQIGGHRA